MTTSLRMISIVALLMLLTGHDTSAQTPAGPLRDLESAVDTARVRAFYELLDAASVGVPRFGSLRPRVERLAEVARRDDRVAVGLINLLDRENALGWNPRPGLHPEAFSNYYGDLVLAVAALKDRRAVAALIPVIGSGRGATDGLADLGDAAISAVLAVLNSATEYRPRTGAAITLGTIAERGAELAIPDQQLAAIRSALLQATGDAHPYVRRSAITALGSYDDAELRAVMDRIAQTDSFETQREGVRVFPVREAAQAWLRSRGAAEACEDRPGEPVGWLPVTTQSLLRPESEAGQRARRQHQCDLGLSRSPAPLICRSRRQVEFTARNVPYDLTV